MTGEKQKMVLDHWDREGGPAFPVNAGDVQFKGMSLRDWFAGQALAIWCASDEWEPNSFETMAKEAYSLADAMLAARKEGQ